jgi:hypothetical protein
MSMFASPGSNSGSGVFSNGYSPGAVPGIPTSPEDAFPAGATDSRARNALILGVLGIVPLSIVAGIPAIVMGRHALRRIDASEGTLGGRNIAQWAIALGCVSVLIFVAAMVAIYA